MTLYEMSESATALYEMFDNGEIDEQTLKDTIESMGAEKKLDDYGKVWTTLDAEAKAIKEEVDRLTARKKTIENGIERLKAALFGYMEATNADKIEGTLYKFRIQNNPESVEIRDESAIPEFYWKKQLPTIDKAAIKEALKDGTEIPGCTLIRTRGVRKC